MTMVSKHMLLPQIWDRIFELFHEALLSIRSKEDCSAFLQEFLSPTEKIMLAKRFAVAVLLAKGNKYQEVKSKLHVTNSTIAKMSTYVRYSGVGLKKIVDNMIKRDSGKLVWQEIQSIFDVPTKGLPLSEFHKKLTNREIEISRLNKDI